MLQCGPKLRESFEKVVTGRLATSATIQKYRIFHEAYMTISTINKFIQLIADAFGALGADVSMHEIERLAMLVHSAMEN